MTPKRIAPTAKAKSALLIHALIFLVVSIILFVTYKQGSDSWVYPWPLWIVAAWFLAVVGHYCMVFFNYEDKGYSEFLKESKG